MSWFQKVWDKARFDSAAAAHAPGKPVDGSGAGNTAAALSHQLLKIHGDTGTGFPHYVTVALWDAYARVSPPVEGEAPVNPTLAAAQPHLTHAEWHRLNFFATLAQIGIDVPALDRDCRSLQSAIQALTEAEKNPQEHSLPTLHRKVLRAASETRAKLTPVYQRWFQRSLALPDGAKRLIGLRSDLLDLQGKIEAAAARKQAESAPTEAAALRQALDAIRAVEDSLTGVLREWCSVAWLVIDEMNWATTPAMVISQVVEHEAVHAFASMEDAKRRMMPSPHRHAFAFFHPNVVGEPLAMVFVALTKGIANNVNGLLESGGTPGPAADFSHIPGSHPVTQPAAGSPLPDTAIFYSITSTQPGLRGIELGNFLIKGVVSELQSKHPHVTQFSTLSPIPGYMKWLKKRVSEVTTGTGPRMSLQAIFCASDKCKLGRVRAALCGIPSIGNRMLLDSDKNMAKALVALFSDPASAWWVNEDLTSAIEGLVVSSVYHYLTALKHRSRPLDPVAGFHLKNGATLHRVNWLGNTTAKGSASSACVMVNYHYDFATVASNSVAYAESGHVAISDIARLQGTS